MAARGHFWSRVRKRFEEIIKLLAAETNSESKAKHSGQKMKTEERWNNFHWE